MSIASKEDKWNTGSFLSSCGEDRHVDNQFKETEAQLGGIGQLLLQTSVSLPSFPSHSHCLMSSWTKASFFLSFFFNLEKIFKKEKEIGSLHSLFSLLRTVLEYLRSWEPWNGRNLDSSVPYEESQPLSTSTCMGW